jgi:dihydrodipicolinate synthase/N-acetylneuraminate lyase
MAHLTGSFAPLVTPFTDGGNTLSEVRLARLVRFLQDKGVQGFVVNTDLGEFTSTSFSERKLVVEIVHRESRGAIPIVAHVTTLNTAASLDLAQHAQRHGARAVLIMPPYYGQFTATEIAKHLKTVQQYCTLPLIIADPDHRVSPEARAEVLTMPQVSFATAIQGFSGHPEFSTYQWSDGDAVCSPLVSVFGPFHSRQDDALLKTWGLNMADMGSVRLLKAAYANMDLDVGSCRSPYLPMSGPQLNVIRALTMLARAKEKATGVPAA